jgi:adenosylhomocysteine nucleosidase
MKKLLIVLLCLCLCLPAAFAEESAESKSRIGIISAMENEVKLLLSEAEIERTDTVGGVKFNVGTLCGQDVVIVQAGIGKVRSAAGSATMLNRYQISTLIFTGIAGGVGDETKVQDIVIGTKLVQHDYGNENQNGFEWSPDYNDTEGYYYCDGDLVSSAYNAAAEIVGKEHVFKGVIATGDRFVASEKYVKYLQDQFNAIACEMEGASVAAVCEQFGVPYVVIRCMSDKADGNAHDTYDNFGDQAADHSGRIVMKMLEGFNKTGATNTDQTEFSYEHDPRDNPKAMRDIVVNPEAVYGFSPSTEEESTLKDYANALDWTDPQQVAKAREARQTYHDSMSELYDMMLSMIYEDKDVETIARAVSKRRNELRLEVEKDNPEGLALAKKRNLEIYGNEEGPTADDLYQKYGSWDLVLYKALGTNAGMDVCLGFYDEYYYLYDLDNEIGTADE